MRREKVKMLCLHQRCLCVTGRDDDIMDKSRKKETALTGISTV